MGKENGFIVLPRKVFNDLSFEGERFSRREAFIDLVQSAEHEERDIAIKGGIVHAKAGDLVCSIRFLANRWGWSTKTVLNTLRAFEKEGKVQRKIQHSICVISISYYNEFQGKGNASENANYNAAENAKENVIEQENTSSSPNGDSEDILKNNKNKEKEKDTKVSTKKDDCEVVDKIYKLYPTTCPVSGRSLGKCSKNKKQIATLLKTRTPEDMELTIREYIVDCKNHNTYVKNFGTFLNQFPDKRESPKPAAAQQPAQAEKRSPELMAIDAMHQGMTDASVVAQGIRFVWGDGITEERINSALFNAGYQV